MLPAQKRSLIRKQLQGYQTLLILAGVVSISLLTLWKSPLEQVTALESKRAANQSSNWQGASFPVENFRAYTSPFGYRPSATGGNTWEFHRGLDLAAPEGSYIRNWWAGVALEVSDHTACGTSVIVQSGAWQHVYCHLKGRVEIVNGERYLIDREGGIQIKQGQQLPSGARIGRIGMTGRTTGPHLHWGLKYGSSYVDPGLVLRAMYAEQQVPTSQFSANRGNWSANGKRIKIADY